MSGRNHQRRVSPSFAMNTLEVIGGIIVAVLTLLGVIVNSFFGFLTHRNAKSINDAVNHRHRRTDTVGKTPPKLYDLAIENHLKLGSVENQVNELVEWRHSYDESPLNTGAGVKRFLEEFDRVRQQCEVAARCEDCPFRTDCEAEKDDTADT
jgi:hypothetical protein